MPSLAHKSTQAAEVNWAPRSDVIEAGTPKRATHPATKFSTHVAASMFFNGIASTHLVDLSMTVSR
jgi:hypothetical protein